MKPLVSIDIETTGFDEDTCQTIEFCAIIDFGDSRPVSELPVCNFLVSHPIYQGDNPYAFHMNEEIFQELANKNNRDHIIPYHNVANYFKLFLQKHLPEGEDKYVPAGKNYAGFDDRFLRKLPNWKRLVEPLLSHRVMDPGNLYWEPSDGYRLPNTQQCLDRAGLIATNSHRAYGDALDVIRMIRKKTL